MNYYIPIFKDIDPPTKVCSITGEIYNEEEMIQENGEYFHSSQIENYVKSLDLNDCQEKDLIQKIKQDNNINQ
jgi:hypothetical protein